MDENGTAAALNEDGSAVAPDCSPKEKTDTDLLEGISDEDLDSVSGDENDAKAKAKLADALGVSHG